MAGLKGNLKHLSTERRDSWTRKAGENIGIGVPDPDRYPLAPITSQGIPVYISESGAVSHNLEVKIITIGDTSTVTQYDGITYAAAHTGEPITIHSAGEIWLGCGYDAVVAGDDVIWEIDSGENSNAAVIGDVMPMNEVSDAYGTDFAGIMARMSAFVGKALTNGVARTDANTFEYVLVRLRGY